MPSLETYVLSLKKRLRYLLTIIITIRQNVVLEHDQIDNQKDYWRTLATDLLFNPLPLNHLTR